MKLNIAQKSWVAYDMGNAAYALIVRTAFAAILFKYCADDVWGKDNTTAYWGYICIASRAWWERKRPSWRYLKKS